MMRISVRRGLVPLFTLLTGVMSQAVAQPSTPEYSDGTLVYLHEQEPLCLGGG